MTNKIKQSLKKYNTLILEYQALDYYSFVLVEPEEQEKIFVFSKDDIKRINKNKEADSLLKEALNIGSEIMKQQEIMLISKEEAIKKLETQLFKLSVN